jgi:hypothetical protein
VKKLKSDNPIIQTLIDAAAWHPIPEGLIFRKHKEEKKKNK